MPPTDELPGNPGAALSGKDQDAVKADEERAQRERETQAANATTDVNAQGLNAAGNGGPPSAQYEASLTGAGDDVPANQGGTGPTQDRPTGTANTRTTIGGTSTPGAAADDGFADGDQAGVNDDPEGANGQAPKKLAVADAVKVQGNNDEQLPAVDLAGVRRLGTQIMQDALESMRNVQLTEEEAGEAKRAAELIAYTAVAGIGLSSEQRAHLQVRAERAQATLLNLAAGKSVQTRQRAKDLIQQTIRRFFSEAITFLGTMAVAAV